MKKHSSVPWSRGATVTAAALVLAGSGILVASTAVSASPSHPFSAKSHNEKAYKKGFKIGFADSVLGTAFHEAVLHDAEATAASAKAQGLVTKFSAVSANGSPETQAQQIRDFTVEGYNAIIVTATSATALNGAIEAACAHGILVVSVNESVTAPCARNVDPHWPEDTAVQMEYFAKRLHGKGNILNVRGVAGTLPDKQMGVTGVQEILKKYPHLKVVATVYGQWTETVTEQKVSAILPSLPKITAVVTQGGTEAGVVEAFEKANKPIPQIVFGNRGNELRAWKSILAKDPGYDSFSISDWPGGIESFGLWTTVALLQGRAHIADGGYAWFPLSEVTTKTLSQWIKVTSSGTVVSRNLTYTEALALLAKEPNNVPQVITAGPTGSIPGL